MCRKVCKGDSCALLLVKNQQKYSITVSMELIFQQTLMHFQRITERLGLEGTFKIPHSNPSYGQEHLPSDQVAQRCIQHGLEHFQG